MSRNRITSSDQATPCRTQHKRPCHDCPFTRSAIRGWLGGSTPAEYLQLVHGVGETVIPCHTKIGQQCAGAAIYRANILKRRRSLEILELPVDRETVFATPTEFLDHHRGKHRKGPNA